MSADRELRADTPFRAATSFPEDHQIRQTDAESHEAIGRSGNESNASGEAGARPSHGPETSIAEEDDDEWDPAMLEQMLQQMVEEDGDDTETETDDRPGWALILSPPLSTSKHSTPPEVMRWVRWPDVNDSLRFIFNRPCHFIRQVACLKRALWLVDYNVDLDAYQFPYGAEGEMRVERPLPRRYRVRRQKTGPTSLRQVESLVYSASDLHNISLNVKMQLWELETDGEPQEHFESESPASKSDDAGPAVPKRAAEAISTSEESSSGVEESQQRKRARHS
ncbi:uncharacterized protein J3D65DRAFT_602197 [Phyllosticta citribraziliensis]|uniref:Uncharacterized protein n=1 Tax=Phyllosticta citribraziliensis TaxID=989973 RepID=A0ABR1LSM7_9PEZI